MDEKTTLAKRLAAYSAAAGIALAAAPDASGQIIFHDIDPDIHFDTGGGWPTFFHVELDFDRDGADDLQLHQGGYYVGYNYVDFLRPSGANAMNAVLVYDGGGDFLVSRLSAGDPIGTDSGSNTFRQAGVLAQFTGTGFGAVLNEEGFAGFRFVGGDGQLHYGWIRLRIDSSGFDQLATTAFEYAYEAAPDTPITAGDVGQSGVFITGSVNQTTFPPEGGTLVYFFTVANNSPDPLSARLRLVAEHNGNVVLRRTLGSATLPSGVLASRRMPSPVPASAPAGTYEVTYLFEDTDSGELIASQTFTITKSPTEQAEANALDAPRTHVLTDPQPNPAVGRSRLTLEVGETQAVRVEVFDALGRQVAVLYDGTVQAGAAQDLVFDGSDLPAGVYVVRTVGETFSDTRIVTLTR